MACYAVYPAGRCFQHHHTGSIPGVQPTEEFVQQPSGTFFPLTLNLPIIQIFTRIILIHVSPDQPLLSVLTNQVFPSMMDAPG